MISEIIEKITTKKCFDKMIKDYCYVIMASDLGKTIKLSYLYKLTLKFPDNKYTGVAFKDVVENE